MSVFWLCAVAVLLIALGWYMGRNGYEDGYEAGVEDATHDLLLATKILFVLNGVALEDHELRPHEYTDEEKRLAQVGLARMEAE